jgi:alpha-ketoglutarate-dependent taurine dioxygenase
MMPAATKESFLNSQKLPLVIEPSNPRITFKDFLDEIRGNHAQIKDQLHQYGGLLFRGYPIHSAAEFNEVVSALGLGQCLDYIGGDSPRNKVHDKVYTSTEASPDFKIPLHNELSYVKHYANHIYFWCDIPPLQDGETIIGDARQIYKDMDPKVRERFEKKGLKYISRYYKENKIIDFINKLQPGHKTWMKSFEAKSKSEVEEKCRKQEFDFKWLKNDWLQIERTRPASHAHPVTGDKVWFNQAHTFDFNPKFLGWWRYIGSKIFYSVPDTLVNEVCFADGTAIARNDMYHILDTLDKNTIKFQWQHGDLLVLDNILAMHGRAPFKGKRRILTALTK